VPEFAFPLLKKPLQPLNVKSSTQDRGYSSVVEYMPSMYKDLVPRTTKKKKKKKKNLRKPENTKRAENSSAAI
jgi:hypothetical protein